ASWPNVKASALRIALAAAEARWPQLLCPFEHQSQKLKSRLVPYRGWQSAALNVVSLPGEHAWMRAKGGAAQDVPSPAIP
ncbi:hypothetical protein, partial [Pantoea rodasii]|uniref:hypothetical protein n=1 Tax=Pantoea rodasii TaxID=1076549 RepID=UPI001B80452B